MKDYKLKQRKYNQGLTNERNKKWEEKKKGLSEVTRRQGEVDIRKGEKPRGTGLRGEGALYLT